MFRPCGSWFPQGNRPKAEREQGRQSVFCHLSSQMTCHHVCHILFVRNKPRSPAHTGLGEKLSSHLVKRSIEELVDVRSNYHKHKPSVQSSLCVGCMDGSTSIKETKSRHINTLCHPGTGVGPSRVAEGLALSDEDIGTGGTNQYKCMYVEQGRKDTSSVYDRM